MLKIDAVVIICTIVNLLILYFGMQKLLFKPVMDIIAKRQEEADKQLQEAKAIQADADATKKECEETKANILKEKELTLAKARKDADEAYQKVISSAMSEAEQIRNEAKKDAENTKNQIIMKAEKEIANMIVSAAEKMVGNSTGAEVDNTLYDEFLNKAGEE